MILVPCLANLNLERPLRLHPSRLLAREVARSTFNMYAVCPCVNMCILHASTGTECFRCKLMWLGKRFYSESVLGLMSITMRP
jgi:hypothetical protein